MSFAVAVFSILSSLAIAEDAAVPPAADSASQPAVELAPAPPSPTRRIVREKEADGTEAINRFKTDAVVKSQYKLNGQSLEVDPD